MNQDHESLDARFSKSWYEFYTHFQQSFQKESDSAGVYTHYQPISLLLYTAKDHFEEICESCGVFQQDQQKIMDVIWKVEQACLMEIIKIYEGFKEAARCESHIDKCTNTEFEEIHMENVGNQQQDSAPFTATDDVRANISKVSTYTTFDQQEVTKNNRNNSRNQRTLRNKHKRVNSKHFMTEDMDWESGLDKEESGKGSSIIMTRRRTREAKTGARTKEEVAKLTDLGENSVTSSFYNSGGNLLGVSDEDLKRISSPQKHNLRDQVKSVDWKSKNENKDSISSSYAQAGEQDLKVTVKDDEILGNKCADDIIQRDSTQQETNRPNNEAVDPSVVGQKTEDIKKQEKKKTPKMFGSMVLSERTSGEVDSCVPIICSLCRERFNDSKQLQTHWKSKHKTSKTDRRFLCEVCSTALASPCKLKLHYRIHTGARPHPCDICGKSFRVLKALISHIRTHTQERPHQCPYCPKAFTEKKVLTMHVRVHTGERLHVCEWCGKMATNLAALNTHKRIHTGEKPYRCETCGATFTQSGALKTHKRVHTGIKPYTCEFCGHSFTSSSQLVTHRRTHTGEKPFQCEHCDYRAISSTRIKEHSVIHSDLKAFRCPEPHCSAAFKRKSHLTTHALTHSDRKSHKCGDCGDKFSTVSALKVHKKSHKTIVETYIPQLLMPSQDLSHSSASIQSFTPAAAQSYVQDMTQPYTPSMTQSYTVLENQSCIQTVTQSFTPPVTQSFTSSKVQLLTSGEAQTLTPDGAQPIIIHIVPPPFSET